MPLPDTIEVTFHNGVKNQNPTTAVCFDLESANEQIKRLRELELDILKIEMIP